MDLTCINCELEYRTKKSGVGLDSMATFGSYQIFAGDVLECPGCGHRIIRRAAHPISEHYKPDHGTLRSNYQTRGILFRSWANEREKRECEAA